jgi:hypothetical protein
MAVALRLVARVNSLLTVRFGEDLVGGLGPGEGASADGQALDEAEPHFEEVQP